MGSTKISFLCFLPSACRWISQESRTLEMNNVQDGVWHGRSDTICIGSSGNGSKTFPELRQPSAIPLRSPELCGMERAATNKGHHSWSPDASRQSSSSLIPAA